MWLGELWEVIGINLGREDLVFSKIQTPEVRREETKQAHVSRWKAAPWAVKRQPRSSTWPRRCILEKRSVFPTLLPSDTVARSICPRNQISKPYLPDRLWSGGREIRYQPSCCGEDNCHLSCASPRGSGNRVPETWSHTTRVAPSALVPRVLSVLFSPLHRCRLRGQGLKVRPTVSP